METQYYLCYVENGKCWFTNKWSKQWGDDWNDAPYEHNAGEPYTYWSKLVEDNKDIFKKKWKHYPIKHKVCYVEFPFLSNVVEPCENPKYMKNECNSKYSVEQINKSITQKEPIPWLESEKFSILPKTTYTEFLEIVKQNNGIVYEQINL